MGLPTNVKILTTLMSLIFIMLMLINDTSAVHHGNGYFARKLDEYFSTIKCMANILEDMAPGKYQFQPKETCCSLC